MTKTQWGYLKKLADRLPEVPAEKFRMNFWGAGDLKVDTDDFSCGYAGCAIGWMPKLVPEAGLTMDRAYNGFIQPRFGPAYDSRAVAKCFGISPEAVDHLFMPTAYNSTNRPITPEVVGRRIQEFLKQNPPEE